MTKKISVIIPVKNRAELLGDTLDNILSQTLKPYEIIVVDDGSEDNIAELIQKYKDKVIFTGSKGNGPGAARNTGITISTGNAIQFFDSDDLMTRNKLEVQAAALNSSISGMVYGPYFMAYQEGDQSWHQKDVIMNYYPLPSDISLKVALTKGWNIITQACLFDADLVKKTDRWNEELMTHEDYLYLFEISKEIDRPLHVQNAAVLYRQHKLQLTDSQTRKNQKSKNTLKVLKLMLSQTTDWESKMFLKVRIYECLKFMDLDEAIKEEIRESKNAAMEFSYFLYKLRNKLGRMKTKSEWQPIHGVNTMEEKFHQYMKQIVS